MVFPCNICLVVATCKKQCSKWQDYVKEIYGVEKGMMHCTPPSTLHEVMKDWGLNKIKECK